MSVMAMKKRQQTSKAREFAGLIGQNQRQLCIPVEPLWTKHIVDHFDIERSNLVAFDSSKKAT